MHRGFKSLGESFKSEPTFGRIREIVRSNDLEEEFNKIFPELKKVVGDVRVDKKTLKLKVENPAWRSELKFRETEIVEKINNHFKETRINNIRFTS
jgi:hypothetical protein